MPVTKNGPASSHDAAPQFVDSEDVIETSTEQPKNVEIRPDFFTMDESGVKQYARELTDWLRDRGAVVRGPKSLTVVAEKPAKDSKKKATAAQDDSDKKEQVYEWSYEWEYSKDQVVTVRFVANNDLDALRGCIDEAFHKRWTVG